MLIVNIIYCKNDEQIFVIFQLNYANVSVVLLQFYKSNTKILRNLTFLLAKGLTQLFFSVTIQSTFKKQRL